MLLVLTSTQVRVRFAALVAREAGLLLDHLVFMTINSGIHGTLVFLLLIAMIVELHVA